MLHRKRKCKTNINANYLQRRNAGGNKKRIISGSSVNVLTHAFCIKIKHLHQHLHKQIWWKANE